MAKTEEQTRNDQGGSPDETSATKATGKNYRGKHQEERARAGTAKIFGYVEDSFYVAVAVTLGRGGAVLFCYAVYTFVTHMGEGSMSSNVLELLDGLLFVFIITELIHTIRQIIDEKGLLAEHFLIVGVVAAIRRLIVVSAESKDLIGKPEFGDAMLELGLLSGAVLLLGFVIFLLRHTTHSEPRPSHEPETDG